MDLNSIGTLDYSIINSRNYKLVVLVDPGLAAFYRSLVPDHVKINRPKYPPHITVVREEVPFNLVAWGKHKEVKFSYSYAIQFNHTYWWLNVDCPMLNAYRMELGLPRWSELCRPPSGENFFHITIGNTK